MAAYAPRVNNNTDCIITLSYKLLQKPSLMVVYIHRQYCLIGSGQKGIPVVTRKLTLQNYTIHSTCLLELFLYSPFPYTRIWRTFNIIRLLQRAARALHCAGRTLHSYTCAAAILHRIGHALCEASQARWRNNTISAALNATGQALFTAGRSLHRAATILYCPNFARLRPTEHLRQAAPPLLGRQQGQSNAQRGPSGRYCSNPRGKFNLIYII